MSNNKPDRKLNLPAETVRVLNPRPKTRNVIVRTENSNNSQKCPQTNDSPLRKQS